MNELEVRTNRGEYDGGQTIYGAVYLRAVTPINAEMLVLTISGIESCTWTKTVPDFSESYENSIGRTTTTSSGISSACSATDPSETQGEREIKQKINMFEGRKERFQTEFNLAKFEHGAVPLGCYAYPFHYTLQQGLPNSFLRKEQYDEIKCTTYKASIKYNVTARFSSSTRSDTLSASQNIEVNNRDITANKYWSRTSQRQNGKYVRSVNAPVKSCCCFPRGELELQVQMERIQYTLGEAVKLEFIIDNKSDIRLEKANIKLRRTLTIHGNNTSITNDPDHKQSLKQTGFPEILRQVDQPINIEGSQKKNFNVLIPISCPTDENLSGTLGTLVKCRYNLEVEIEVPWDADVSINMPLRVYPGPSEEWSQWNPPEWINELTLCQVNGICAVAKHLLESKEFQNVPLPNNTRL